MKKNTVASFRCDTFTGLGSWVLLFFPFSYFFYIKMSQQQRTFVFRNSFASGELQDIKGSSRDNTPPLTSTMDASATSSRSPVVHAPTTAVGPNDAVANQHASTPGPGNAVSSESSDVNVLIQQALLHQNRESTQVTFTTPTNRAMIAHPHWTVAETKSLIEAVTRYYGRMSQAKTNNMLGNVWEDILYDFNLAKPYRRSRRACQDKWHQLVKQYKDTIESVRRDNVQAENVFTYYQDMHRLLGRDNASEQQPHYNSFQVDQSAVTHEQSRAQPQQLHQEQIPQRVQQQTQVSQTQQQVQTPQVVQTTQPLQCQQQVQPPPVQQQTQPPQLQQPVQPPQLMQQPYPPHAVQPNGQPNQPNQYQPQIQSPQTQLIQPTVQPQQQKRAGNNTTTQEEPEQQKTIVSRQAAEVGEVRPVAESSQYKRRRTTEELLEMILLKQEEMISVVRERTELERQAQYRNREQHQELMGLISHLIDKTSKNL
jgi:hypothetical protein